MQEDFTPTPIVQQPQSQVNSGSLFLKITLIFLVFASISTVGVFMYAIFALPSMQELKDVKLQVPMEIYDRNNKLIGLFGEQFRKPISLSSLPSYVPQAFLAAEDARFYSHSGIDVISLLRAVVSLVKTGRKDQGGSTITMQLARNFFLTKEKKFSRKFIEILLALKIERSLSKNEILELYLNKIFFGYRAYGISAAARVYFGKEPSELTIGEAAVLATLPQRPSANNPIKNPFATSLRKNEYVLPRMRELGYINKEEYKKAIDEKINASYHPVTLSSEAGYLSEQVRLQLESVIKGDLFSGGYKVYTTLDSVMQNYANEALRNGLIAYALRSGFDRSKIERLPMPISSYDPLDLDQEIQKLGIYGDLQPGIVLATSSQLAWVYLGGGQKATLGVKDILWARPRLSGEVIGPAPNAVNLVLSPGDIIWGTYKENNFLFTQKPPAEGSIVVQNPHTGEVLVMVGGYDFVRSKFNRATQAKRQIGSSFKPFLYTVALENGFTPSSIIQDEPVVIFDSTLEGQWRPDNYSDNFEGPIRFREALVRSRNLVSIRILQELGLDLVLPALKRFGFTDSTSAPKNLSLALGAGHNTPLNQNNSFAVFANGGYKVSSWFINKVLDSDGKIVYYQSYQASCQKCFTPPTGEKVHLQDLGAATSSSFPIAKSNPNYKISTLVSTNSLSQNGPRDEKPNSDSSKKYDRLIQYNQRIIDPRVVFIVDSILKDVTTRGTAVSIGKEFPDESFAGKTGTTNDSKDSWFVGFNRSLVATVWVGYDDYTTLGKLETGSSLALPIWISFMKSTKEIRDKQPNYVINYATPEVYGVSPDNDSELLRTPPSGIIITTINKVTGLPVDNQLINLINTLGVDGYHKNYQKNLKVEKNKTQNPDEIQEYYLVENILTSEEQTTIQNFFQ
ncbi:MAG: PBP1A family penicillin-binding protein [Methylacidiphilales bacterium]|nr:PBP1A family penicillin-binding protein [Candidatus Methylacidiphilales bacterium]